MGDTKPTRKAWKSRSVVKGSRVELKRAIGYPNEESLDPFLVLDDVCSDNSTKWFPWHPHRGIESITYILHGEIDHMDSMGNGGTIRPGDALWITTGSGIIHQETLRRDGSGRMRVIQLSVNLPTSRKKSSPCYREVKSCQIPEVLLANGVKLRIVCGEVGGVSGPVRDTDVDQQYLDVTVPAHGTFSHPVKEGITTFVYVMEGTGHFPTGQSAGAGVSGEVDQSDCRSFCSCEAETIVLFTDCDQVAIAASAQQLRFLLVAGKQITNR